MWIVEIKANPNGSHNDHKADHITSVPEGWAMIPDGFPVPNTFPFVSVEAEEVTHTRKIEVYGEGGEISTEHVPYTVMTVTKMYEGIVPEAPEPAPTQLDQLEAQVIYTAMMTDTLLEV